MMKIDMHIHTKYSFDTNSRIEDIIRVAKAKGLDGIAITDHETMSGVEEAKRIAGTDFTIIPGEEIFTSSGEIIGYMLTQEIHCDDPYEVVDMIKEQGGMVSIPHAFDSLRSSAMNNLQLIEGLKKKIDFIEINGRCIPRYNALARRFAHENKISLLGGSDAHSLGEVGRFYTIVDGKLEDKRTSVVSNDSTIYPLYIRLKTKVQKALNM